MFKHSFVISLRSEMWVRAPWPESRKHVCLWPESHTRMCANSRISRFSISIVTWKYWLRRGRDRGICGFSCMPGKVRIRICILIRSVIESGVSLGSATRKGRFKQAVGGRTKRSMVWISIRTMEWLSSLTLALSKYSIWCTCRGNKYPQTHQRV
jgi:hypothetical protein